MLYSQDRYPEEMNELPEKVREKAIKFTNDMIVDGNIRHHEDLIIAIAIQKAKTWQRERERSEMN